MTLVSLTGRSTGLPYTVVAEHIVFWEHAELAGQAGTEITLDNGRRLLVAELPIEVERRVVAAAGRG